MRTSEEIFHRVRWDPRFDPARFVLGITVRGAAPQRLPLTAFVPGGDIPWHRVVFVEADGEVVWDRTTGVDRLDSSDAGRVQDPRRLRAPFFTARPWQSGYLRRKTSDLRVLTWNTLWDRYHSDLIDTAGRRRRLLTALDRADADVIALQEVERPLLAALPDSYALFEDVAATGLVLLSRLPVREAGVHMLGPHKAVAAITVELVTGPLVVATTHLTSDHSTNGPARRALELAQIAEGLAGIEGDVVLMGDFNDDSDAPAATLALRDAWTDVHGPHDRAPTFDPVANPLAAISSLTGRPGRLDRVLVRGPFAVAAVLHKEPVSDHYGVAVSFSWTGRAKHTVDESLAADVTRRVVAALPGAAVHVVGSRRLGCALPGADLDLVVALPGVVDPERVAVQLGDARPVVGARVPGVRLRVDALDVDVVLVGTGSLDPAAAVARRATLDPAAEIALSAVSDAEALLDAGMPAALARRVKAWARVRGLDSAPHGGLPGLAWMVMAACSGDDFFGTFAAWDWREPIGLAPGSGTGPVVVLTPSAPVRSCTEQVSAGFRDLLTQELYEAWESGAALSPPPMHRRHAAWAVLTVPDELAGRVRGRLRALVTAIEEAGVADVHAWPRPFAAGPGWTKHAIGLGRTPPSARGLAALTIDWVGGLPGVQVAWADGEEVPALS
jgi:endonuclease/exonuclease/phosphatase family metal-dependent hydrolase/uncharacterized protein (UPF0248 family)